MQFFALLLCSSLVVLVAATKGGKTPETVVLHPPVGRVRGSLMTSRLGRKIYSFRGLRYAESPTGEQRFKPSVPVAPWTDVFDATQEGPSCPQIGGQAQSEDCLRLNVYTTKLPVATKSSKPRNPKRPVIVYFHPGAFYVFTGQSYMVGPQYLMDQDVVLVSVNYRLGVLGFVSTGDALAPGNLGLKDQVVALKWVRDNIASFGGDPDSVTIAGYSAGAYSVSLHLLSPMTKGLFHRAIVMSGSPTSNGPIPNHQKNLVEKQAEVVGCPTGSTASILDCLKTKSAQELADSLPKLFEWRSAPALLWAPVVEPEVPGVERYLPAQPVDLLKQGKIHNVPLISGVTKDEFSSFVVSIVEDARKGDVSIIDEYNSDWDRILPITMGYERDTTRSREISAEIKNFYFKGQPLTLQNVGSLGELSTDYQTFCIQRFVKLMSQYSTKPVYNYEFTYQGRYSWTVWNDTQKPYGIVHHDDLIYLLYYNRFPFFEENAPEIPTLERMTAIWAHFAKTGEPIPKNNPKFANVAWTPFTMENQNYLDIGNELVIKSDLKGDKVREWERIFPLPDTQPAAGTKGSVKTAGRKGH